MEQRTFNTKIDNLIANIEREMVYDHKALSNEIYDKIYDQLDYNFQEFDDANFEFKADSKILLEIKANILSENKVIQKIEFLI